MAPETNTHGNFFGPSPTKTLQSERFNRLNCSCRWALGYPRFASQPLIALIRPGITNKNYRTYSVKLNGLNNHKVVPMKPRGLHTGSIRDEEVSDA